MKPFALVCIVLTLVGRQSMRVEGVAESRTTEVSDETAGASERAEDPEAPDEEPLYSTPVHAYIAYLAAQLDGVPEEMRDARNRFLVNDENIPSGEVTPGNADLAWEGLWKIADVYDVGDDICEGAYEEDLGGLVVPGDCMHSYDGSQTHFWRPDDGPHGGRLELRPWPLPDARVNAYEKAARYWQEAIQAYRATGGESSETAANKKRAYFLLGKVAHLLTDMGMPAHVHLDRHPGEVLGVEVDPDT